MPDLNAALLLSLFLPSSLARLDPYIVCEPPVPDEDAGWPPGYNSDQYYDNIALCSALMGRHTGALTQSVGCLCVEAKQQVLCDEFLGDSNFWPPPQGDGALMSDGTLWSDYCISHCRCTTKDIANSYRVAGMIGEAEFSTSWPATEFGGVLPYGWSNYYEDSSSEGSNNSGDEAVSRNNTGDGSTTINESLLCSAQYPNCTNPLSCSITAGCKCRANSSTFIPGDDVAQFTSSCILTAVSGVDLDGLKTRDQDLQEGADWPCPCNVSYVSHACCDAGLDGMVWEPAEAKLGKLWIEQDL